MTSTLTSFTLNLAVFSFFSLHLDFFLFNFAFDFPLPQHRGIVNFIRHCMFALLFLLQNYQFEGSEVGPDTQRKVLTATVTSPLCEKYPPSLSYQRSFMKHFVHKVSYAFYSFLSLLLDTLLNSKFGS